MLRTFSKIYGMAGLRAGAAYGRPDLIAKVREFGGARLHAGDRDGVRGGEHEGRSQPDEGTDWRSTRRIAIWRSSTSKKSACSYIPSVTNFFMMQVKGMTGQQVGAAMAQHKVDDRPRVAGMARRWCA